LALAVLACGGTLGTLALNPLNPSASLATLAAREWWAKAVWVLYWKNIALFAFNMTLVMFPMDAGRVLQNVLWARMGYAKSMRIATLTGLVMAVLVGLVGLFLMVAVLVGLLPRGFMTPAVAGLMIGVVLLGASMGWLGVLMGPIEFLGVIGNVMSYLRIAAIGLASVYLAKVANEMAGLVGNLIVGVVIAVLLHALNLVMGAFSPTIHGLRLHYVEFFRKFYQGGGRPYEPFGQQVRSGQRPG